MSRLTEVELLHIPGRIERWLRFGRHVHERIIDRRRRVLSFHSGEVFAFVRWASNDHGTIVSRLDILRTVGCGEPSTTIACVAPGAEILLRLTGWPKVERGLAVIDAAERTADDGAEVSPDYWRHVQQRMVAGDVPSSYDRARHHAWLLRRRLLL